MPVDVAIITAIYDDYDTLKPVRKQAGLDVEWIVVTDNPELECPGYSLFVEESSVSQHPNRAAKYPKMFPWRFTAAPASIWIDASFKVISETFASEAIAFADPIAQFAHPWRNCIYEESGASIGIPKYAGEPIVAQTEAYRQCKFPANFGLWATGVIARRHTEPVKLLGNLWNTEINAWSFQDQISQPYALWKWGMRPAEFPGTHFANDWLLYEGSGRH